MAGVFPGQRRRAGRVAVALAFAALAFPACVLADDALEFAGFDIGPQSGSERPTEEPDWAWELEEDLSWPWPWEALTHSVLVEVTPYFEGGPGITGHCSVVVKEPAVARLRHAEGAIFGSLTHLRPGRFEKTCWFDVVYPGGMARSRCTSKATIVVRTRVVSGEIAQSEKDAPRYFNISLEMFDHTEKEIVDCMHTVPGSTVPSHTENFPSPSGPWPMVLYSWPLEQGHSEELGRFRYTLVEH